MEKKGSGGGGGGSLRWLGSLRLWDSSADGAAVFSRREQEVGNDEEALLWAALAKLPTYDRVRRGLLAGEDGMRREVDVREIPPGERKDLLNRLVKTPEEDHERFLLSLKNRIERVGINLPTVEVRFEHLNLEGEAFVASRQLPASLVNSAINVLEGIANTLHILPRKKRPVRILRDVGGIVRPHRMTLLLGPPRSGKTSLLLALAGKLGTDLKVSGRVTYNGHGFEEFVPQRVAAYIDQYDLHIGQMTVRETLAFSARCQGVGSRYDMLTELSRREKAANIKPDPDLDVFMKTSSMEGQQADIMTEYILKILGLGDVADTMVGNQMFRGISGGEKKRVTAGEMLVGPATVFFIDEISTGLDNSTTFQIVNSIRQSISILGGTAVISLLQPAPETYMLFDDIILLSDGQIVFQGPREHAQGFFESMGFRCPDRKGVADFLLDVTSRKDQHQYWVNHDEPYRVVTAKEFVDAFWSSQVGRQLAGELYRPFAESQDDHPAALTTSKYGVSKKELLKSCFARELLLTKRNAFAHIFKLTQHLVSCIIASTAFLRTKMHHHSVADGRKFMASLFLSELVIMLNGLAEAPPTIDRLPVFYKQRDLLFFPAWAYALPIWVLRIPFAVMEVSIWVFISYYTTGLDPNAGRFFKQYLLLLVSSQMASALFRFLAACSRNVMIASTLGFFVLLLANVLGGFSLSREDVKKWWKWGYWSSPMSYMHNAICTNEFFGASWKHVLPGSTEPLGKMVLKSYGVFTESKFYWIGVGALVGYMLVFNLLFTLALAYLNPLEKSRAASEATDHLEEQGNNTTVGSIEPALDSHGGALPAERRGETRDTINASSGSSRGRTEAANDREDLLLPSVPLSLTFHNIRYSVDMPEVMKGSPGVREEDRLLLLKDVSGAFRPGVLTALMGSSGAGKTTLMDVLAGRKTGGYIEGSITVSGYPKKHETFARISGYCEQTDIHSPNITVYESALYSAWLRLPSDVDSRTRKWFVDKVMELVELTPLSGAMVGLPGVSGLSREQRKRLTIAVELVANPSIIFMDEPTTGLDARAAAVVIRTVRNVVDAGRAVVCTIHQPSIDIFEAFDELLLMKRGGQQIYFGPIGHHSSDLINYFERIDRVEKIKDGCNPATWMLEQTAPVQEETLGVDFHDIYKNSELFQKNEALIEELSTPPPGSKEIHFPTKYAQPYITQCAVCLWKQSLSYWRNRMYTAIRFFFTLILGLLLGSIYWDLGRRRKRTQDIFNVLGSMFSVVVFMGRLSSFAVQAVVAIERTVFYRERAAGMYSALCYAFGQVVIEIPYIFLQSVVYVLIIYPMIDFEWTAGKFFWYLFFMCFTLLYFTFFGMMVVGLTPNGQVGGTVSSALYLTWIIFCGFMLPRPRIPRWWRWIYWTCPVSYTLYGLVASQYGDEHFVLETGETLSSFLRRHYGFRHGFLPAVACIIAGFALFFAVVFAISIKTLHFNKR